MTSNAILKNGFWHRMGQRLIQTTWKDSNKILKDWKETWYRKWLKYPFYVNFANNIEIKCRERCNWSETNSNDMKCKKNVFVWLEMQGNIDKYTAEKIFQS